MEIIKYYVAVWRVCNVPWFFKMTQKLYNIHSYILNGSWKIHLNGNIRINQSHILASQPKNETICFIYIR